MWLPKPVYKALPVTYALVGVLFIMGAVYLDLQDPMSPIYLGLGAVSIAASITVSYWRATYPGGRLKAKSDRSQSADTDN
jgi:hypothetical protein